MLASMVHWIMEGRRNWGRDMDSDNRGQEGHGEVHQTDPTGQASGFAAAQYTTQGMRDGSAAQQSIESNREGTGPCTWTTENRGERGNGS